MRKTKNTVDAVAPTQPMILIVSGFDYGSNEAIINLKPNAPAFKKGDAVIWKGAKRFVRYYGPSKAMDVSAFAV